MAIRTLASCENELHEDAIRRAGVDDFGDPTYREGLRVLLKAFDTDLKLTETGWRAAYDLILQTLTARLYTQRGWAEHPDVLVVPIHRPLVIIGLPRTGTTALHRLLSVDPQFQGLETWLSDTPMPRPVRENWETQPEYRACVADLEAFYSREPDVRRIHELAAGELEECIRVLPQNFVIGAWAVAFNLPMYGRWVDTQCSQHTYQRYADVLRLIGARESHKRWLLKSPYHMHQIETLLEVFPNACIVQTHRDPLSTIPSYCSLLYRYRHDFEGEAAQREGIGPQQCAYWRRALERTQAAREKWPMHFFDVDHRRFLAHPLEVVQSIYDNFGITLSTQTAQRMREWIAASPTSRHGKHDYPADSWGIRSVQICDAFADYRAQHQFN